MPSAAVTTTPEIIQKIDSLIKKAKTGNTSALKELASFLHTCMEALNQPQKKAA